MKRSFLLRLVASWMLLMFLVSGSLLPAFAASAKQTYLSQLSSAGIPSLYQNKLWSIHQAHPKWKFVAYETGLSWADALSAESSDNKNLVYIKPNSASATRLYRDMSTGSYTAKNGFDYDYTVVDGNDSTQTGWIPATSMAIAYYMNPYTFIGNDITLLQFESLEWNFADTTAGYNSAVSAVDKMLSSTYMSSTSNSYNSNYIDSNGNIKYLDTNGNTKSLNMTYAEAICTASKENNINPCYLASKILGEQGAKGSSSVTGNNSTYPGYYNYLNIGAYESSSGQAVKNGLKYAKSAGWSDPQKSIAGGASQIAKYYIARGQNTAYLQKFNVSSYNTYSHQYMGAVNGVVNTTYTTYSAYKNAGILDNEMTFYIPVFKNMPSASGTAVSFNGYAGSTVTGTVNASANVRNSASYAGTSVATVPKGTKVTVTGGYRDTKVAYVSTYKVDSLYYRMFAPLWYKVKLSDGTTGYICEDYLDIANKATLKKGNTLTLKYSVTGNETPRFMSQDTRIATVNSKGVVTAVGTGTTKIIVYLTDGQFDVLNLTVNSSGSSSSSSSSTTTTTKPTTQSNSAKTYPSYSSEDIRLVKDSNGDYYCYRNGKFVSYTGIAKGDSGTWWYCENGELKLKTVLAKNQNGWYYCEKGKVTFTYNGLATNSNGTYVCQKSKVNFNYNGTYTSGGKTYNVQKGKVVSSSSTSKTCPYTEPTYVVNRSKYEYGKITKGNEGVKWVQWWLTQKGYYTGSIDGFFGPTTENAVKKFQSANKMTADGSVGPATRAALKK